jgi:hypothetical protein
MSVDLELGCSRIIINEAEAGGFSRHHLAYMLATAKWETAHTMEPVREAYWLSEEWREANLRYYPWYGRGFVQLTWEENYQRAQEKLGLGTVLTDDPDMALEPSIAGRIMLAGMSEGWFTGKKLSDYITPGSVDFVNARRIINGTDHASDIASIAAEYDAALIEDGYGSGDPVPDPTPGLDEIIARYLALEAWAIEQGYEPPTA